MNTAIINERRRARKWRDHVFETCRFWFPAAEIDFPALHNPEFATDLTNNDPHEYDAIVCRGIGIDRLH